MNLFSYVEALTLFSAVGKQGLFDFFAKIFLFFPEPEIFFIFAFRARPGTVFVDNIDCRAFLREPLANTDPRCIPFSEQK